MGGIAGLLAGLATAWVGYRRVMWFYNGVKALKTKEREMEAVGIKETKELVIGANELVVFLITRLKDGAGIDDAIALSKEVSLLANLQAAASGVGSIAAECKDLSLSEGLELGKVQLDYLPKIIAAARG